MGQRELIRKYVAGRLFSLAHLGEHPQRAALANLRRGVGKRPGELPRLWGEFLQGLPEELLGRSREPSRAEWAVYLALTLYALHSQGHALPGDNMHREGVGLGTAVRRLALAKDASVTEGSMLGRFNSLATASGMEELSHHLRAMVELLRSEGIALDYVRLADDLFRLQLQEAAPGVKLAWGRDYYRMEKAGGSDAKETARA